MGGMHVVMIAAMSQDGFLTQGNDPSPMKWTSEEDKKFYHSMLQKNNLYILGSRTFKVIKNTLPNHAFKIVMAHNVSEQTKMPNVLFTDASFPSILQTFEANYSTILVLGGSSIYHQMLEQRLIDEIYLTVEPVQNGHGVQLATHQSYFEDFGFVLEDIKLLNAKGTKQKHYLLKK